jgi:hypothetical protein
MTNAYLEEPNETCNNYIMVRLRVRELESIFFKKLSKYCYEALFRNLKEKTII